MYTALTHAVIGMLVSMRLRTWWCRKVRAGPGNLRARHRENADGVDGQDSLRRCPTQEARLLDRLLRRVDVTESPASNGHFSDVTTVEHDDSKELH
jgi:hypothetical protein